MTATFMRRFVFVLLFLATMTAFAPLTDQSGPGSAGEQQPPIPYACLLATTVPENTPWKLSDHVRGADGGFRYDSACGVTFTVYRPNGSKVTRWNFTPNSTEVWPEVTIRLFTQVAPGGVTIPRYDVDTTPGFYGARLRVYIWPIPLVNKTNN